jgi:hypothetical protein
MIKPISFKPIRPRDPKMGGNEVRRRAQSRVKTVIKRFRVKAVQYFMTMYTFMTLVVALRMRMPVQVIVSHHMMISRSAILRGGTSPDKVDHRPFPPSHPDLIFDPYSY